MPKQIARWNPARDVWETETTGLFCEHSDVFSATWPASGMTRAGVAYELPTSAHPTDGSASSSLLGTPRDSPAMTASTMEQVRRTGHWGEGGGRLEEQVAALLPTPVADHSRGLPQPGTDYASLPNVVMDLLPTPMARDYKGCGPADAERHDPNLSAISMLLPTPRATDGTNGGPNMRGSSGDLMLPSAVQALLPTPTTTQRGTDANIDTRPGARANLHNVVDALLPTPTAADSKASGGSSASDVTLTDAVVRTSLGASTNPRFAAGSTPSDE